MQEGRGRRYKEGDRMVERRMIFGEYRGENFCRRREERRCWNRGEENWRRGLTPEEELHSSNKEVAIGFIGTWARGLGNPSVS